MAREGFAVSGIDGSPTADDPWAVLERRRSQRRFLDALSRFGPEGTELTWFVGCAEGWVQCVVSETGERLGSYTTLMSAQLKVAETW